MGHFDALHGKKVNARKNYKYWLKNYTNPHLLVSNKDFMSEEVGIQLVIAVKPISWVLSCDYSPGTN